MSSFSAIKNAIACINTIHNNYSTTTVSPGIKKNNNNKHRSLDRIVLITKLHDYFAIRYSDFHTPHSQFYMHQSYYIYRHTCSAARCAIDYTRSTPAQLSSLHAHSTSASEPQPDSTALPIIKKPQNFSANNCPIAEHNLPPLSLQSDTDLQGWAGRAMRGGTQLGCTFPWRRQ